MSMKNEPVRMCIVCRQRSPKRELERFVTPDTAKELESDGPVPDPTQQGQGRGYYLCGQIRCRELFPKVITGLMKKRKGDY